MNTVTTPREKHIQNDILRTFGTRKDMRLWRANVGASTFQGPYGNQRVTFGVPGQADLSGILLVDGVGVRLEVEVKSAIGRQSDVQKNFQSMIEKFGGLYILARSVEDVQGGIDEFIAKIRS